MQRRSVNVRRDIRARETMAALAALVSPKPLTQEQTALLTRMKVIDYRETGEILDGMKALLNATVRRTRVQPFGESSPDGYGEGPMMCDYPLTALVAARYRRLEGRQ